MTGVLQTQQAKQNLSASVPLDCGVSHPVIDMPVPEQASGLAGAETPNDNNKIAIYLQKLRKYCKQSGCPNWSKVYNVTDYK